MPLVFYLQHQGDLSPIANLAFPQSYDGYLKSVAVLHEVASSKGAASLCSYVAELGREEITECVSAVSEFSALAGQHINKEL